MKSEYESLRDYLLWDVDTFNLDKPLYMGPELKDDPESLYKMSKTIAQLIVISNNPDNDLRKWRDDCFDDQIDIIEKYYNSKSKMTGNWWYWRIGIPLQYTIIKVFRPSNLDRYEKTIKHFVYDFIKHGDLTYANLASACKILYMAGILLDNQDFKDVAMKYSVKAIKPKKVWQYKLARKLQNFSIKHPNWPHPVWLYAGKEGIFEDGSFIQHTSVPSTCSYGIEVLQWIAFMREFNRHGYFEKYCEEINNWFHAFKMSTFDGQAMLGWCGRKALDSDMNETAETIKKYLTQCTGLYERDQFIKILPASDTVICDWKDWRFFLSMYSDRVASHEILGYEGTKSRWVRNGTSFFYRVGDDNYSELRNGNPNYIPGNIINHTSSCTAITEAKQPLFDYDPKVIDQMRAGGCGRQTSAVAGMKHIRNGKIFCRSWHMFEDCVVCINDLQKDDGIIIDNRNETPQQVNQNCWIYDNARVAYASLVNSHTFSVDDNALILSTKEGGIGAYVMIPLSKDKSEDEAKVQSIVREVTLFTGANSLTMVRYKKITTIFAAEGNVTANTRSARLYIDQPMCMIIEDYTRDAKIFLDVTVSDFCQDYRSLKFSIENVNFTIGTKRAKPGESMHTSIIIPKPLEI